MSHASPRHHVRSQRHPLLLRGVLAVGLSLTAAIAVAQGPGAGSAEQAPAAPASPPPATVSPEPDGGCAPLDLAVGQVIVFALPGNAGTGYRWVLVDPRPLLEPEGEPIEVTPAQAMAVGGARLTQWRLRAARAGQGTLRAEYRRPWESGAAPGATDDAKRVECRFDIR